METRAHYVAVGAFVLAMIVLGFVAVLWLARTSLTTEYARFDIYFRGPVTGLRNGAEVDYNGVPVGRVVEIKIVEFEKKFIEDEDTAESTDAGEAPASMIRVTADIDANVPIKQDARASIETNILSGVSSILIARGSQSAPVLQAKADERYPVIRAHRSRLAGVVARAPELLEKANNALERVSELLGDKNQKAFAETLDNIRVFSGGLAERNKDIADLVSNANTAAHALSELLDNVDRSYTGTDGLGNRAATALTDFDRLAKNLSETNRQLQLTLGDVRPGVRTFSQQTLSDVGSLVGEARQLISGMSRLVAEIERDPSRVLLGDRREGYRPK
jgi:phospholipid/cholesterol/gamma-HCH transport system substrate-binding protein